MTCTSLDARTGTDTIPGLKGKIIGIPEGTIADFYLGRFLELNQLNLTDITLVDVRPENTAGAITNGTVDAVVTWHPYLDSIPGQNTGNVTVWDIQSGQLRPTGMPCAGQIGSQATRPRLNVSCG